MSEEQNNQKKEPTEVTLGLILGWGFGVLATISGVTLLFSEPVTGILALLLAAVLLPPANRFVVDKFNLSISGGLKLIIVVILLGVIGATMPTESVSNVGPNNQQADNVNTQEQPVVQEWHEVQTFSGKGNQDTSSFTISSDRVRISAITSGGTAEIGTYSSVSFESDNGGYLGPGLSISTEGAEDGQGETTYRNLEPGSYYISVISGVNWEVVVEEYR